MASSPQPKRTVWVFAWASFLNDFGSDMIYPVWPLFLRNVLGANMAVLGLIDGLGDAVVSLSQAASGYLSDRWRKRKVFVWLGYLMGAASRVGYAVSTVWTQIIPFRILDRAGKLRGAPRDAIIADLSTQANRGRHFGFLRTMDNLGAVFGIVLTILLIRWLGYRTIFLLAALPSLIGVGLVLWLYRDTPPEKKIFHGVRLSDMTPTFRHFLLVSAVFAFGAFSYSFLMIFAQHYGCSITSIPILYLIFTVVASLFSLPFGRISDRVGRKSVLMGSFALWAAVCALYVFAHSRPAIILGFVLFGLHKAALDAVQKAFVAELAPVDYRASFLGGFQMVVGLVALPGSLLAGWLWDAYTIELPFLLSLILSSISFIALFFIPSPATMKSN